MNQLQNLQDEFQHALLDNDPEFRARIVATQKVDTDTRIGIYSNAYRSRLIEAMEDSYDAVHTLLGDEQFYELCHRYITAHPSKHYSIRWFGHRLAEFTRETSPYCEYPYISELADFQWKLMEAFDAPDRTVAELEQMAVVPPEVWPLLTFEFNPSIRRLNIQWNVPEFWQAVDAERDDIEPPQQGERLVPWVIYRKELKQYFRSMEPAEAWALDQAMQGTAFAEICEGVLQWKSEHEAPAYAAQLLQRWISDHMVCTIKQ